jgi:hypothetical protein
MMPRNDRLLPALFIPLLLLAGCAAGTGSPEPDDPQTALDSSTTGADESAAATPSATAVAPPTDAAVEPEDEPALEWSELSRMAREHVRQREYAEARERLGQAALQLAAMRATDTRRRTIFGRRAALALQLAHAGQPGAAEELTYELLEEAEEAPGIAGSAWVVLVLAITSDAPPPDDEEEGIAATELALLRTAWAAAREGPADRDRLRVAYRLGNKAEMQSELELARGAFEDAAWVHRRIVPTGQTEYAGLRLDIGRIALELGDVESARAIYAEVAADPGQGDVNSEALESLQRDLEALDAEELAAETVPAMGEPAPESLPDVAAPGPDPVSDPSAPAAAPPTPAPAERLD